MDDFPFPSDAPTTGSAPTRSAPRTQMDGAMRSAISQAIVRIHADHYGKGATQAKTYVWDNVVVTVLRDVLTVAERTLVNIGSIDTVRDVRTKFQFGLEETFTAAIERLTGRRVHSFMSQVDPVRGVGVEVFVLEPEPVEESVEDNGPAAA
jgi:uncharacterized protein YbcI